MKVPLHIVKARRARLAQMLKEHQYLPVGEVCARLGISEATARRDLEELEQADAGDREPFYLFVAEYVSDSFVVLNK